MKKRLVFKTVLTLLCAAVLCANLSGCLGLFRRAFTPGKATKYGNDLLTRIYLANDAETLRQKHESVLCRRYDSGDEESLSYADASHTIIRNPKIFGNGVFVSGADYSYVLGDDGAFSRLISFDPLPDPWAVLDDGILGQTIERVDDYYTDRRCLEITAYLSASQEIDYWQNAQIDEEAQMRTVISVDYETLELQSIQTVLIFQDDTRRTLESFVVLFDENEVLPEADAIEPIEAHLHAASEYRSTTFVLDAQTDLERRYTYQTPVGDGCLVFLTENGTDYEIDYDSSTPTNDAKDNDAIYYLKRVEALVIDNYGEVEYETD